MKKFWKRFFKILKIFVKKCGELLYKFLSFLMETLYFFYISFGKNFGRIVGKNMQLWGFDMDIDTKDKYRYLSIPESVDKYWYFSHH